MTGQADSDKLVAGVRNVVGVAALRRLRRLVDRERAQDVADARALPRVLAFLLAVVILVLLAPTILRWLPALFA